MRFVTPISIEIDKKKILKCLRAICWSINRSQLSTPHEILRKLNRPRANKIHKKIVSIRIWIINNEQYHLHIHFCPNQIYFFHFVVDWYGRKFFCCIFCHREGKTKLINLFRDKNRLIVSRGVGRGWQYWENLLFWIIECIFLYSHKLWGLRA